jgi:hypothetical protein
MQGDNYESQPESRPRSYWPYWRTNDECETYSLHSILLLRSESGVSISVLVLRFGCRHKSEQEEENDRLLRDPVRLLPSANRVR